MDTLPKLLQLNRSLIAHIGAAKRAVEVAAGLGSLTAYPWIAAVLLILRAVLSYYESVSIPKNPINVSAIQTISTPEPMAPPVESAPES